MRRTEQGENVREDTNTIAIAKPQESGRAPTRREGGTGSRGELGRMVGIDFARFLAIIGMFCAHLLPPAGIPGHISWLSSILLK